jgi:KaiC/GvpD/RAD55 family RecA-like ATPase
MTGSTLTESDVKRAYSKQVVISQAKRFGWNLKERVDGKLIIMKARL